LNASGSGLREYLSVLRRRKWIALLVIVIVPVAAVALSMLQTPRYAASAEVLLGRQNLANSLNNVVDPTSSDPLYPQVARALHRPASRLPEHRRREPRFLSDSLIGARSRDA